LKAKEEQLAKTKKKQKRKGFEKKYPFDNG
jgi:hypothetical protein